MTAKPATVFRCANPQYMRFDTVFPRVFAPKDFAFLCVHKRRSRGIVAAPEGTTPADNQMETDMDRIERIEFWKQAVNIRTQALFLLKENKANEFVLELADRNLKYAKKALKYAKKRPA